MFRNLTMKPKTMRWFNLPMWAAKTAGASFYFYQKNKRPFTFRRLACLFRPNLDRPIFVLGAARTGTTFLGDSLGALPDISYHHEPVATKAAARYVFEERWSGRRARLFFRGVYAWLMRIHLDADLRFAEKTPRNCHIVGFLADAFPTAQFVHIIRDGRDVALSHSRQPWLTAGAAHSGKYEPGGYPEGPYARFWVEPERTGEFETTSDIHRCIWAWRSFTAEALQRGSRLPPHRYLELRYEDLVTRPKEQGDRLLAYLGIQDPRSISIFHTQLAQARTDSVGRWRSGLSSEALREIETEAGPLLRQLGYPE